MDSTIMNRAYVTLVNDWRYLEGAKVLAYSLQATGTPVPLIIIASDLSAASMEELREVNAIIWEAPHIEINTQAAKHFPARSKTFSKINAWLLSGYDKCVFLDADVVVLNNLDYLFDYPQFAAVGSEEYFNTGVFVFTPCPHTHEELVKSAMQVAEDDTYRDDSEQEMLQRVFRKDFYPLPWRCNFRPYHGTGVKRKIANRWCWSRRLMRRARRSWVADAIHYIGYPKPWEYYLPQYSRDTSHFTWSSDQIKKAEWSFQIWLRYWNESQLQGNRSEIPRGGR